ncbi:hypothetical protein [Polyangium jinanense]|uniref:Uncharacterized protein n=1 Tax=Polyangium jinanense TaxID=2829994 RepID=A0A9X4AP66_9BACT|nr:hypothetical protein [Polyangium jinanense]MDC3953165.1 hypothetical protein [Polyangium jinanense]MDC3979714.1 hypothetical protein [Polyangium jinanense]
MGAFFTNVHVRLPKGASFEPFRAALIAAAEEEGAELCAEGAEPDRTVLILGPNKHGWVSIYDERTEGQDQALLDGLAALASRALGAPAITVLVHDSDVLCMDLFAEGACVDRYNSHPSYFGEEADESDAEEVSGHPERWASRFALGISAAELSAIWSGKELFAEATLAETARALGAPPERMGVGYRYLDEKTRAKATALRFRLRERPGYEAAAAGPTVLVAQTVGESVPARFSVGDELRVSLTTHNHGGPSQGLQVVAWGEAITQGLVKVERFEVLVGDVRAGAQHENVAPSARDYKCTPMVVAELEKAVLPAGVPGGFHAMAPGGDWQRAFTAMQRAQVHVNVVGRVVSAGAATLHVGLKPLAHREGRTSITYELTLDAPLWRPLRAAPEMPSQVLLPLSMGQLWVAFVVFPDRSEAVVQHAAQAFEKLATLVAPASGFDTAMFLAKAGRRPDSKSAPGKGFFEGARWRKLVEGMHKEQVVTVQRQEDMHALMAQAAATGVMPMPGLGVSFGGSILPQNKPETAVLSLWVNVTELAEAQVSAERAHLVEVVEGAMERLGALQGFLTRWGTAPSNSLNTTPYEVACGIHGDTLHPSWASRWLRAVGSEATWIGAPLLAHLDADSRKRLAQVADVRPGTGWLRVEPRPGESLTEIEQALAALLPER